LRLIQIGFEFGDCDHKLLLGDLPIVRVIGHTKDIPKSQAHILQLESESINDLKQSIKDMFLLNFGLFDDSLFLILFGILILQCLIDLLLLLEMVFQKFDTVAILFD
jgi:hypothetical protein